MIDANQIASLTGRILLAVIFLASAFGKITNFEGTTRYMAAHGMPLVAALCAASILVEVFGGLSLVLGFYAKWGAAALFVYLIPTTLIFHWGPDRIHFLKNLAIMGGLLQMVAFGPGELSLDRKNAP